MYTHTHSSLVHWYMACTNRYDTVQSVQTCRAYAGRT